MTAGTTAEDAGNFGLSAAHLVIKPGVPLDEVAADAMCLLSQALEVFDGITEVDGGEALPNMYYAGLYLLRQANIAVSALQMSPIQGRAAMDAGGAT